MRPRSIPRHAAALPRCEYIANSPELTNYLVKFGTSHHTNKTETL
jgi:hypothetical protein